MSRSADRPPRTGGARDPRRRILRRGATGVLLAKPQDELREFIGLLNSHNVEYVIVGGHAGAFHGHPRFAGDIDFFIRMMPPNADDFSRCCVSSGLEHRVPQAWRHGHLEEAPKVQLLLQDAQRAMGCCDTEPL